jgi:hypothetical protein
VRPHMLKQITKAARARYGRFISWIRTWWRDVQADQDRRINLFFLYTCVLLTATAIGGFLWLTGIFDWRGSNGRTEVIIVFDCDGKLGDANYDVCDRALESDNQISVSLDLQHRYDENDTLNFYFNKAPDGSDSLRPLITSAARIQIISSRSFEFPRYNAPKDARVSRIDKNWYSTSLPPAAMAITFSNAALTRFTGLAEREFSIRLQFLRGGTVLRGKKELAFVLIPPDDFDVVDASSPNERSGSGYVWTSRLANSDGNFLIRARMRNFEAARLDHILDSSIAAVLGVAVGGILSAYLALVLLRRHRHA